jgi:hypothetical protein
VEGGEERELVGGVRLYIYWVRNRPTPSDLAGRYGVGRLIEVIGGRHVGPWVACGSGREAAACLPQFSFSLTFIIRSEITGIMLRSTCCERNRKQFYIFVASATGIMQRLVVFISNDKI